MNYSIINFPDLNTRNTFIHIIEEKASKFRWKNFSPTAYFTRSMNFTSNAGSAVVNCNFEGLVDKILQNRNFI